MSTISSSLDIYNSAYSKFTPDWIDESNIDQLNSFISLKNSTLWDFFNQYIDQFNIRQDLDRMDFAEFGCGLGAISLELAIKNLSVSGFDISELAIAMANEISQLKNLNINYKSLDLVKNSTKIKFDFIIDSHLLHCITSASDRLSYLENIYDSLNKGGICIVETMVFNKDIQFPVGYEFDATGVVHKLIDGEFHPVRCLKSSIEIEKELKDSGFKIDYLYYHNELAFDLFNDYKDYPVSMLPKTLRIVVKKT